MSSTNRKTRSVPREITEGIDVKNAAPSDGALAGTLISTDAEPETVSSDTVLKKLRADIDREHGLVLRAQGTMLVHAINAGALLIRAKNSLAPHVFRAWVENEDHSGFALSMRTAQRYIQVATELPQLLERLKERASTPRGVSISNDDLLKNVSIRQAVRLVSQQGTAEAISPTKAASERTTLRILTPWPIVEAVNACVGELTLDPAADVEQPDYLGAALSWTPEDDGLRCDRRWSGTVFVHPPKSNQLDWIRRALSEFRHGSAETVILLVAASSDSEDFRLLAEFPRVLLHSRIDGFSQPGAVFLLSRGIGAAELSAAFRDHGDTYVSVTGSSFNA
jgi:hypothetical protein